MIDYNGLYLRNVATVRAYNRSPRTIPTVKKPFGWDAEPKPPRRSPADARAPRAGADVASEGAGSASPWHPSGGVA